MDLERQSWMLVWLLLFWKVTHLHGLDINRHIEKLVRALSTEDWYHLFPNVKLEYLTATASKGHKTPNKHFKFKNVWLIDPAFDKFVQQCW